MIIDIKYAIGDKVKFKFGATIVEKEACTFCNESGTVAGADGTYEDCPRCEGKGYIENEIYGELIHEGIIQDIQVHWFGKDDKPWVSYRMAGWSWSQTWISEDAILEVLNNVN